MKCIFCQKEFVTKNHVKLHINHHHNINEVENEINYLKSVKSGVEIDFSDIKKMYNDGYNVTDIAIKYGLNVRNYIKLIGIARNASESKKTKIYIDKVKSTLLQRYGVDNLSKSEKIKEKKKQTYLRNYGYENNFCNSQIRTDAISKIDHKKGHTNMVRNLTKRYGPNITNPSQLDYVRKKISTSQKNRLSKLSPDALREMTIHARNAIKYTSSHEIRIQSILNELNISYTANGFLYAYNWDFLFKKKIILEVQGDFWHANPKFYKKNDILLNGLTADMVWKKDYRKKQKVEKHGYVVYYLWENDLLNMSDGELKEKLIKMLC